MEVYFPPCVPPDDIPTGACDKDAITDAVVRADTLLPAVMQPALAYLLVAEDVPATLFATDGYQRRLHTSRAIKAAASSRMNWKPGMPPSLSFSLSTVTVMDAMSE